MDIKIKKIFLILSLSLTGCCWGKWSILPCDYPIFTWSTYNITSIYYNRVYYTGDSRIAYPISNSEIGFGEIYKISICSGKCTIDENNETISFYQDAEMKCYLFSYDITDFEKLKKLRKMSTTVSEREKNDENQLIFVIMKDRIDAMTVADYKKLQPTLTSFKNDKNVCKPK